MRRALKTLLVSQFFIAGLLSLGFAEEKLTITTFYPSPYGSYRQLAADQIAIGSGYRNPTYADGDLYVEGKAGIGTNSPGAWKLYVNGSLHVESASTEKITDTAWTNPSDGRLKNIVGNYNYGLKEILLINPIRYTYKKNNALKIIHPGEHIGIIAQEVQAVIPEAITVGSDGYLRFTADPVMWATINAIKELKSENDEYRKEITLLKSQVKALSAKK
ncbi:MAG: tail fiber domain-containing protein [Candidatus Omnitrophota bacterium]